MVNEKCSKCNKSAEDYSFIPFPEVFEIYSNGICNLCIQSFERYKVKKDEKTCFFI